MIFDKNLTPNPTIIDLKNIENNSNLQMQLEPGDIIYIPKSSLVEIKEILSFVSTAVTMVTGIITAFN